MIKVVYPNCAGLDVHKKFVTVCRLTVNKQGQVQKELREYSTMTADLQAMADWLAEGGVTHVAMESTASTGIRSTTSWKGVSRSSWSTPKRSSACRGARRT